jgi:hypothetical protein
MTMNPSWDGKLSGVIEAPFLKPMYRIVSAVIVLAIGAIVLREKPRIGFVHPKSRAHPTRIDAMSDRT